MNDTGTRSSGLLKVIAAVIALVVAVAIAVAIVLLAYTPAPPGTGELTRELRDRGRIAVVGDPDLLQLDPDGAQLIPSHEVRGLDRALEGTDEDRLASILHREGIAGILADGRGAIPDEPHTLRDRLRAYDRFDVLRGAFLTPVASLYVRARGAPVAPAEGALLARAARQIVSGSTLPPIYAFPEALRRTRNVEVLVMLRSGGQPRLWRSARGGSIARALITAATVARDRWMARSEALGPLDRRLPSMRVDVYLLAEDGTIGDLSPAFIERVITPEHGAALEERGRERGTWHYLLPDATRERGTAMRAYAAVLEDAGLPADAIQTRDLRLYRLVAKPVGTSPPGPSSSAGASRAARSGSLDPLGIPELVGL